MEITIKKARLSFPALFKAKAFEEGQEPKYSATALLDKKEHAADIKALQAKALAVAEEKWGKGKVPKGVKFCLRDGAEKPDMDGYGEAVMFFSAASPKRPAVVDKDLSPLDGATGKPYAGCYINIHVRLWAQDNKFGKRINAELKAVQFVKDGEPFGNDKPVDAAAVFGTVDDDEDVGSLMGG